MREKILLAKERKGTVITETELLEDRDPLVNIELFSTRGPFPLNGDGTGDFFFATKLAWGTVVDVFRDHLGALLGDIRDERDVTHVVITFDRTRVFVPDLDVNGLAFFPEEGPAVLVGFFFRQHEGRTHFFEEGFGHGAPFGFAPSGVEGAFANSTEVVASLWGL